jgi:pyruvate dehydrogenase E2 component (dihydrolipoamide acetyltransferase)
VPDAEIDAYIAAYVVPATGEGEAEEGPVFGWAVVDGIRVRYALRGPAEGVPVLFLHGFGGDLGNWMFNLDAIAEAAPVIALDLPAHGQSDVKLPGTTLADLAGFVHAFLGQIGVDRVHVVGHSMGGAVGIRLAIDHPGRVASLALVNSAGLGPEIDTGYTQGFVDAASRRELKPVVEQLFADPSLVTRQLLDDLLKFKRIDGVTETLGALGRALFRDGRQAEQPGAELAAKAGGVPVLVVAGRDDRIVPAAHAGHAPPGARVELIDGAGHMLMMEKAGEFNALLKRHLGA